MSNKTTKPQMYKVVLDMSGKKYKAEDKDLALAIEKIGLKWFQIKSKGLLKVSKGTKKAEKLYNIIQLKRLYSFKENRQAQSKFLISILK